MLSALLCSVLCSRLTIQRGLVVLVPPEPLPLGGYTERGGKVFESQTGDDFLFARTLIIATPGERIAVVSVEMLTIPESLHREVARRLPKDIILFLSATH